MRDEEIINQIKSRPRIGVARQLARKLLKETNLSIPPISLGKIILHLQMEKDLAVQPVEDFGEKISGVIVMIEDSTTIGFNKKQHWYRRRFTIAHEIGHLQMNTTCAGIEEALLDNSATETDANEFAAELLMPLMCLKQDFKNGIKNIDDLSERYRMSKEAIGWKIIHSGVLTK